MQTLDVLYFTFVAVSLGFLSAYPATQRVARRCFSPVERTCFGKSHMAWVHRRGESRGKGRPRVHAQGQALCTGTCRLPGRALWSRSGSLGKCPWPHQWLFRSGSASNGVIPDAVNPWDGPPPAPVSSSVGSHSQGERPQPLWRPGARVLGGLAGDQNDPPPEHVPHPNVPSSSHWPRNR